jgi:hypothetical protein
VRLTAGPVEVFHRHKRAASTFSVPRGTGRARGDVTAIRRTKRIRQEAAAVGDHDTAMPVDLISRSLRIRKVTDHRKDVL